MKTALVLYLNQSLSPGDRNKTIEEFTLLAKNLLIDKLVIPVNSESRIEILYIK